MLVKYIEKPKAFIAKKELARIPVLKGWMEAMNCVLIDRDNARDSIRSIKEGVSVLKAGYSLVLYPEGTRSKDGSLGEFKSGGLRLATKSKVDVVPVTIDGTKDIMQRDSIIIKPAKVKVIISPPIKTADYDGDTKLLTQDIKNIISKNLNY